MTTPDLLISTDGLLLTDENAGMESAAIRNPQVEAGSSPRTVTILALQGWFMRQALRNSARKGATDDR